MCAMDLADVCAWLGVIGGEVVTAIGVEGDVRHSCANMELKSIFRILHILTSPKSAKKRCIVW